MTVTAHSGGNQLETVTDLYYTLKTTKSFKEHGAIMAEKELKAVMVTAQHGE